MGIFTKILQAKLKKEILGIVDLGNAYEYTVVKRKGKFLEEDKKKNKRVWVLLHESHIKYSPDLKCFVVYLSSQRAVTLDKRLIMLLKEGWKDGIRDQKQLMNEFVEEWAQDEEGNYYPVKLKSNVNIAGISISAEHVSEVLNTFDPQLLYSYVENEISSRIQMRTYGIEVKTFITVFIAVLLAVIIAWVVIKNNAVNPNAIAQAVKNVVQTAPKNVTTIPA